MMIQLLKKTLQEFLKKLIKARHGRAHLESQYASGRYGCILNFKKPELQSKALSPNN